MLPRWRSRVEFAQMSSETEGEAWVRTTPRGLLKNFSNAPPDSRDRVAYRLGHSVCHKA